MKPERTPSVPKIYHKPETQVNADRVRAALAVENPVMIPLKIFVTGFSTFRLKFMTGFAARSAPQNVARATILLKQNIYGRFTSNCGTCHIPVIDRWRAGFCSPMVLRSGRAFPHPPAPFWTSPRAS